MLPQTKQVLSTKITEYMKQEGLTFLSENPFPVSWRTIWAIRASAVQKHIHYEITFSRQVQKKMLDFFNCKYKQVGSDYVIL